MMYNMVNNVRGSPPRGKKEEAIPMARKWLSGALAFAMIFGCSAPVALADETPVEVVEEAALEAVEQDSLEGVEQYISYAPSISPSSITFSAAGQTKEITVSGAGSKATVKAYDHNTTTPADEIAVEYEDGVLKVTSNATITSIGTDGKKFDIAFTNTGDTYANSVTLTVKHGTAPVINVDNVDSKTHTTKDFAYDAAALKVGETSSLIYKVNNGKAPSSVEVELSGNAKKYYEYTVTEVKSGDTVTGIKVTFKAIASMTSQEIAEMYESDMWPRANITAKYEGATDKKDTWYLKKVNPDYSQEPTSVTLNSNTIKAKVGETIYFAAQVKVDNDFGGEATLDDYADIVWLLDGEEVKFDTKNKYVIKDELSGAEIGTLVKSDKAATIAELKITSPIGAGTYSVSVKAGNQSHNRTVSFESNTSIWATDKKDVWMYKGTDVGYSSEYKNENENVILGGTADFSDIKYAYWDSTGKTAYDISVFGGTYKLTLGTATVSGKNEKFTLTESAVKAIATIDGQKITVADATNATMAALLERAGDDATIVINVVPEFKFGSAERDFYTDEQKITVTVVTAKDEMYTGEFYVNGEKKGTYDGSKTDPKWDINMPVLYTGRSYTLSLVVKDSNGQTTGVSQSAIWTLKAANSNSDIDVNEYFTLTTDGNTATLTPKKVTAGDVKLVMVPEAATNKVKEITLYVNNDPNATPTPAPTETPKPTEQPTEQPTQAPTQAPTVAPTVAPSYIDGKVTTSGSNLNIRAEANTSSTIVVKAPNGTALKVYGESGNFYKVEIVVSGVTYTGYASKDYVTLLSQPEPDESQAKVVTSGSSLNVRKGPGTSYSKVTSLPNGTIVTVVQKGSSWTKISATISGKTVEGYVSNQYLEFIENAVG